MVSQQMYSYSITEGLPQSQVFAICQDSFGYLWAGTQGGGLAKFDGQKFDVFTEQHGLPSNYINALLVTTDNTLWVGTPKGLCSLSSKATTSVNRLALANQEVTCLAELNQIIYAGTKEGLYQYNKKLDRWQDVTISQKLTLIQVNDIKVVNEELWVATEKGLWIKQRQANEMLRVRSLPYPNIQALLFDGHSSVWLSVLGYGLLDIDPKSKKIRQSLTQPLLTKTRCMVLENSQQLWLGTENEGVCSYDVPTGNLVQLTEDAGLSTSKIRALLKDSWGNLWMGTSGAGLLKKSNQLFKNFNLFDYEFGSNRVYAVSKGGADKMFFAVSKDNLGYVKNNAFHVVDIDSLKINAKIKSLACDTFSRLWLGTEGKGLYCVDSTSALHFSFSGHTLSDDFITRLLVDEKNRIWLATQSSGISVYELVASSLVRVLQLDVKQGLTDKYINSLARDPLTQKTWFAGRNGSCGFISDDGQVTVFNKDDGLPNQKHQNLALSKAGQCCVAVEGMGVYCNNNPNPSNAAFKKLASPDKPFSSNIYSMLFDSNQFLWLGSENGVYKLTLEPTSLALNEVTWYSRDDGFGGIESCHNSICTDNQNNIWFGTMNGLVQYNPGFKTGIQSPPALFIKDVFLFNKSIDHTAYASCFQSLPENLSKTATPPPKPLEFSFDAVHLNYPTNCNTAFSCKVVPTNGLNGAMKKELTFQA
ncbi:MAG: hypothetical protein IPO65_07235 [Saprospiraceae bacterium]|nr:hypothetical protein [Saprospiraceae bacterium]